MRIDISKRDVIWSYIGTIFSLSSYIIILPLIVKFLSEDMVGLWYVFVSIGAIANLFDFGFTYTFARNITYCWSGSKTLLKKDAITIENNEPDFRLMKDILNTSRIIYFIIASIALLLLLSAGTLYISYLAKNIVGSQHITAWVVYSIAIFLNLYYNYFDSYLVGVGAIQRSNQNKIISRLIHIIVLVVLLYCGLGIIGAATAYLSYGIVFRWLGKKYFYKYKNIGEELNKIKEKTSIATIKSLFTTIWYNAWRDGIIQLSIYATDQATVLICSAFLTLKETGIYSIALQIATAIAMVSSVLYNTYQPQLQAAYVSKDYRSIKRIMNIIVRSLFGLFLLGTMFCIFIGFPILQLLRDDITVSIPVFIGICAAQFVIKYRNCYTTYFSATNRIIYTRSFVVSGLICIVLSVIFLKYFNFGPWGLILAQLGSQAIFNIWYWPLKAKREISKASRTFNNNRINR